MELENKRFDEHIKKALEGIQPAVPEEHWNAFEHFLEETINEDLAIDTIVANNLGAFEAAFNEDTWDVFEEKLSVEEAIENETIDNLANQNLNNYEAPYQEAHWLLMAKRLEEEFSLRRKLYKYKVLELGMMLLLLITFINYMPFGGNKIQELKNWKRHHFDKRSTPEQNKANKDTPIALQAPTEGVEQEDVYEKGIAVRELPIIDSQEGSLQQERAKMLATKITQSRPSSLPFVIAPIQIAKNNDISNLMFANSFSSENGSISANKNLVKTSLLAALDLREVNPLSHLTELPAIVYRPEKNKALWRFSFFTNADLNYIISDEVPDLQTQRDTTFGYGYGGGLMIGFKKGRFGFEFGGQYTHKKYPPNTEKRITNQPNNPNVFFIENIQDIQLDILQIPLNVQYYVMDSPKWKIYSTTGASLNLITLPVHQIESQVQSFLTGPVPPGGEPANSFRNSSDFPEGVFSGGKFRDNSYLTANLGFGVEGAFSPRWSVYMQPTYQHYFSKQGIKPFDDKFYTISLSIGTRVNLK